VDYAVVQRVMWSFVVGRESSAKQDQMMVGGSIA